MKYDDCNIAYRDQQVPLRAFLAQSFKNLHILPETVPKSSDHISRLIIATSPFPGTNCLI